MGFDDLFLVGVWTDFEEVWKNQYTSVNSKFNMARERERERERERDKKDIP